MAVMHSYLVTMVDRNTQKEQQIVVESPCEHGMDAFVEGLSDLEIEDPVIKSVIGGLDVPALETA